MDEEHEDITCCHRITIFHPTIRNMLITKPVIQYFDRVTWANLFDITTYIGIIVMTWAVLYFLFDKTMIPNNDGFGLYFLAIFSYCLGNFFAIIPYVKLPPTLGMLIAGLIVRNSGLYNICEELGVTTTAKIRTFCVTFIMIRFGLQLSFTSLTKNTMFIIILAIVPSSIEILTTTVYCRFILSFHWDWSFMTGTIISGISPVVIMGTLLALVEQGYGEAKKLDTILCIAACIDAVYIIFLFVICFSIVFTTDEYKNKWWLFISIRLRDLIVCILMGIFLGICFIFFPHRSHRHVDRYRVICLVLGSLMCTTGISKISISGVGYLSTLMLSFISITGWKILSHKFDSANLRRIMHTLWKIAQPILIGVMGADIDITLWTLSKFGLHLFCILIGLMGRCVTAYSVAWSISSFTWKERLFLITASVPKGTLQL
ncbi:sodium/hydrogen exchanger 9B1-like isoform X4 [Apis florea]|uniref:sodium/hydrogen exchanger 9B1-like isoform X4 n=1 Tax=Apis florea TaxID=7463 RepID=UPI0012FF1C10|nr:sodium/hydrogen exchanger 9B1-like isoform X4 [Apis florea]